MATVPIPPIRITAIPDTLTLVQPEQGPPAQGNTGRLQPKAMAGMGAQARGLAQGDTATERSQTEPRQWTKMMTLTAAVTTAPMDRCTTCTRTMRGETRRVRERGLNLLWPQLPLPLALALALSLPLPPVQRQGQQRQQGPWITLITTAKAEAARPMATAIPILIPIRMSPRQLPRVLIPVLFLVHPAMPLQLRLLRIRLTVLLTPIHTRTPTTGRPTPITLPRQRQPQGQQWLQTRIQRLERRQPQGRGRTLGQRGRQSWGLMPL